MKVLVIALCCLLAITLVAGHLGNEKNARAVKTGARATYQAARAPYVRKRAIFHAARAGYPYKGMKRGYSNGYRAAQDARGDDIGQWQ